VASLYYDHPFCRGKGHFDNSTMANLTHPGRRASYAPGLLSRMREVFQLRSVINRAADVRLPICSAGDVADSNW
jgi:hypothetical protein